jgi:hypothetical protein
LYYYTRNVYKILVGKPEGKRPLRRPRCRWENNIRMDLREAGWEGMLTRLFWLRIGTSGSSCGDSNEPSGSIKGEEFIDLLSDCWLLKKDSVPWN